MTTWILIYVAVSLVLGGTAAMIDIWIDRWLPKKYHPPLGDALWFGLFVAISWPLLLIGAIL